MTALATASGGYRATAVSGIDRAIRLSTAVAVLAVAGIAAYVSYWHAYAVIRAYGDGGITARLEPATIDLSLIHISEPTRLAAGQAATTAPIRPCDQPWAILAVRVAAMPSPSSQRASAGTGTRCRAAYRMTHARGVHQAVDGGRL